MPHSCVITVAFHSAALAPTNQADRRAFDDRLFLQLMYNAGLRDYCDVVGVNALGFAYSPDDATSGSGLTFSRVKTLHDIMVANGDANKQVWTLEMCGLRDTATDLGPYNWMKVPEGDRARYLKRAYEKAYNEWPWMGVMFVWNLDFGLGHIPPWPVDQGEQEKAFFGLLERQMPRSPAPTQLPSYLAVKEMPKPPAKYTLTPVPSVTPMPSRQYSMYLPYLTTGSVGR